MADGEVNDSGRMWGVLRSTLHDLSVKNMRRVAGAAGFDVSRVSANAEAATGFGSKTEVLNGLDALFREMPEHTRSVVLPALAAQLLADAKTAEQTSRLLAAQGLTVGDGRDSRVDDNHGVGGVSHASGEERRVSGIRVFMSHVVDDVAVATALVDVLRSALNIPAHDIRCTSVDGYRLPGGADTDEHLRREIREAPVFIGLVSTASVKSFYVLFELGARWGAEASLIPVLTVDLPPSALPRPIAGKNALRLDSAAQVHQLVVEVGRALGATPAPAHTYQRHIDVLVQAASHQRAAATEPPSTAVGREVTLSADAARLLVTAVKAPRGDVMVTRTQQGFSVGTNGEAFCREANGRDEAHWRAVVRELMSSGLLEQRKLNSDVHYVTKRGFDVADQLKS